MNSKAFVAVTSIIVILVLVTGACSVGFVTGSVVAPRLKGQVVQQIPSVSQGDIPLSGDSQVGYTNGTPKDLTKLFGAFWQAWNLVHNQYVDQPVDDQALMRGAIKGMLEALGDKHTSYMTPDLFTQTSRQLNGDEYEGIGAWVDVRGEFLSIISPMPGSPAEKAGLKPGDLVVGVDGQDMTGVDGELVRQKILGPRGSTVKLTIQRKGVEKTFEVEVQRAGITVPTVSGRMLDSGVAYVRLYTFGDKTSADLRATLKDLMEKKPSGLILDLRNNGGGYLKTAIEVTSEFIGDGVIMYEQYGDGRKQTFEAERGGLALEIPLVVLINEGSASASEIVAGAIQDRGRGQLVGNVSYGKGSVQTVSQLKDEQGAVRITIARWLTPNGQTIHGKGLTPDVKVEITEEDIKAERDSQLDKAIELLTRK